MSTQQQLVNGAAASHGSRSRTFDCAQRAWGASAVRIHAVGELDLATTPDLERELRDAEESARLVLLDLHEVTFLDTAGVHLLIDESIRALGAGKRLILIRVPAHVLRIFDLTGTRDAVEILDI